MYNPISTPSWAKPPVMFAILIQFPACLTALMFELLAFLFA